MMKIQKQIFLTLLLSSYLLTFSQVGIGTKTINSASVLELTSTKKGVLTPRMTTAQRNAISSPATGLLIYNLNEATFNTYNGTSWTDFTTGYQSTTKVDDAITSSLTDEVSSGMILYPPAGTYRVNFNSEFKNNPITTTIATVIPGEITFNTSDCFAKLTSVIAALDAKPVTNSTHPAIIGNGETILPGKYFVPAAIALAGNLTLDAGGNPDALFIIQAEGAIDSSVFTKMYLTGGAKACNVFWLALGGVGIGADCIVKGNFIARTAAVAVGFRCEVEGRLLSGGGAIAFGPGTASIPSGVSAIDLGIIAPFIIYTHAGGLGNVIDGANTTSIYTGLILSDAGAATGFETATMSNPVLPELSSTVTYGSGPTTTTYSYSTAENNLISIATFSIYQNGILVPNSTQTLTGSSAKSDVQLVGIATVAAGQPIEIRWKKVDADLLMKNRILTLVKVR
jgi:hypothetical protein